MSAMKIIGIASPYTSSGKTTVTITLANMAENSAIFKIGPDFIDTGIGRSITGYAENIDRYLEGKNYRKLICEASKKYKIAIFEGVMGLYDSGLDFDNSTYYYFKKLGIPHVIVIDISSMAESAYRIYKGFRNKLTVGVILNNYRGEKHLRMAMRDFIKNNVRVFGAIPHREDIKMESRHLGLLTYMEQENVIQKIESIKGYIDKEIFKDLPEIECNNFEDYKRKNVKISIAMDRAFNFYYQYNINLLSRIGNVSFFSPLKNEQPEKSDIIYIGGGYPEIYRNELSRATKAMDAILEHYNEGRVIYGECGGLMYMMESIEDSRMLGIFRGRVKENAGLTLSYTELVPDENFFIFKKGERIYGHEFHYSSIETEEPRFLNVIRGRGIDGRDGLSKKNAFGSYTHVHFFRYRENIKRYINKIYKQDSNK